MMNVMSMVERVGRAIAEANQEDYMEFAALHDAMARAAIEAIAAPEITEDEFYEIEEAAARKMREWERGYYCQDIRIQHHMAWWIAKEVEARYRAALNGKEG